MLYDAQIFIQTDTPIETLAAELQVLLDITWSPAESWGRPSYEFLLGWTLVTLHQHTYVNDLDRNFEDFLYALELETRHIITHDDLDKWQREIVQPIYERLKDQGKYCLMLVDALQFKLDEYCPESA